jgi:hypothetical protein
MINFVDSLNKGLELSQQVDKNKKEIDAVFAELNRQINEVYTGKLIIERKAGGQNRGLIIARNPTVKIDIAKPIAHWEQSATGYPFSITLDGQKHICDDKESLELEIADLLADPFVAKTLLNLIDYKTIPLP